MNTLAKIQSEIKVPKGQFNKFGNYKYRSCEDIVESAKPVLNKYGFSLLLSDSIIMIGARYYIQATATITNGQESFSATAYAREEESKKGMDGAQITGAASSYARKYALNGLFAIDDTKDADSTNTHNKETEPEISEKGILINLVHSSDLSSEEKEAAFSAIDLCSDYNTFQKIQYRLEERQPGIEQTINPSQKQINKHLKNTI